jgi:protein involved in polysaccharide export with SLBB domain
MMIAAALVLSHRWTRAADIPATQTVATAGEVTSSPIAPEDFVPATQPYTIAAGDLLRISVIDPTGANAISRKTAHVDKDGSISLPLIGGIKVAGSTKSQAEDSIGQMYHDRNLIKSAKVNVDIIEARAQTFRILGDVNQPGEYAISKSDLRLFDALNLARGIGKGARVYVTRGQRQIEIQSERIEAADPKVNIVIRPKDAIIAIKPQLRTIHVVVAARAISMNGQETDWDTVRKELGAAPADERSRTCIELAAVSADLPVRQYFSAKASATQIVKDLGLSHVSDAGIETDRKMEYYIMGHVARSGVYSLSVRAISLSQAVVAAGGVQDGADYVTLIRRSDDGNQEYVLVDATLSEILNHVRADVMLKPNDQVLVYVKPSAATQPVESPRL